MAKKKKIKMEICQCNKPAQCLLRIFHIGKKLYKNILMQNTNSILITVMFYGHEMQNRCITENRHTIPAANVIEKNAIKNDHNGITFMSPKKDTGSNCVHQNDLNNLHKENSCCKRK